MRWLWVLVLMAAPAFAQVAGVCGPGKRCTVDSLSVGATLGTCYRLSATTSQRLATDGYGVAVQNFAASGNCTGASTAGVRFYTSNQVQFPSGDANAPALSFLSNAQWGIYKGSPGSIVSFTEAGDVGGIGAYGMRSVYGYSASTAFASFPTCNAAANGRLLFDSTNNRWRQCVNGTGWLVLAQEWTFSGYLEDGSPRASYIMAETVPKSPGVVTNLHVQLTNSGPTSASGNYIIKIRDQTAGTDLCTVTKTCASGTGSNTCSGAVVAGNRLTIVADSSACGAGTLGSFNVVAHINGG